MTSLNGNLHVYKSDRLFLLANLHQGETVAFPINNNLYFGLTKTEMKQGDIIPQWEKVFSPLAKLDTSFLKGGVKIEVSDNPAGRPHVVIDRI